MSKAIYSAMMSNFFHGGITHGPPAAVTPPAPVTPPPVDVAPTPNTGTTTGGVVGGTGGVMPGTSTSTAGFGGVQAAGFFVAGFGADFFNQYNSGMMNGFAQYGQNCGFGFGFGGGAQMPAPMKMDIGETALKHCGYKKGTKNTLNVGNHTFVDKGHGQMEIKGKDGKMFTVDVNRCSAPPQIEIHANGDKNKKAMMKVPLKDLQKGGSIALPDGTQLNLKANAKGNNLESFQVKTPDGQVATMDGYDKGNASWKSGGEAMQVTGPQLKAGADLSSITKGAAAPTPGQIAQGNVNHLQPMANMFQQSMPGMFQNPAPQMQQAGSQMQMVFQMFQLMMQLSQMFQMTRGSMFSRIR